MPKITHSSQIKPLGTRFYRIKVENEYGHFRIENARTGATSDLYDGRYYLQAYECLLAAYNANKDGFNRACEMEMKQ